MMGTTKLNRNEEDIWKMSPRKAIALINKYFEVFHPSEDQTKNEESQEQAWQDVMNW